MAGTPSTAFALSPSLGATVAAPSVGTSPAVWSVSAQAASPQFSVPSSSAVTACAALALAVGAGAARKSSRAAGRQGQAPAQRRVAVSLQARGGDLSYEGLVKDIEDLVKSQNCGPILIRLSWHDAGVFSTGALKGGCPNAAMRFTDGGEGAFGANAGLPTLALKLLDPITQKYCPDFISNADLWALAANVAIKVMGGPDVPTRFGRTDAKSSAESVESQVGRLPDGDKGVDHLREIFGPKGFDDKGIVALSGAHTVGQCHLDFSGFDGPWTANKFTFDNTYFKNLVSKQYTAETTAKGCPQNREADGTIMLISDLALLEDPGFKACVEKYAADQDAFFADYKEAWVKLQELGCSGLRSEL